MYLQGIPFAKPLKSHWEGSLGLLTELSSDYSRKVRNAIGKRCPRVGLREFRENTERRKGGNHVATFCCQRPGVHGSQKGLWSQRGGGRGLTRKDVWFWVIVHGALGWKEMRLLLRSCICIKHCVPSLSEQKPEFTHRSGELHFSIHSKQRHVYRPKAP